jgi:4-aminobutyrate aminotransferase-like enzyme
VLDVLQLSGLPERAVGVGARLRERLRELADGEPLLGEVRGVGLLAGVDIRSDGDAPSRVVAGELLELLVEQRVLTGLTGPRGDVLKVRPPLVWESTHADLFVERLSRALGELRARER